MNPEQFAEMMDHISFLRGKVFDLNQACKAKEKKLRKLVKVAKRFQLADYDDEKGRQGRIWDDLYEAIEEAEK